MPAWGELHKGKAPERFTWLESVLSDRDFVAGANYSVADITALIAVNFARVVGFKVTDAWPNLARTVPCRPDPAPGRSFAPSA